MPRDHDRPPPSAVPTESQPEREPEWVEAIRRGREARGERLREVFAAFDDDEAVEPGRDEPPERRP